MATRFDSVLFVTREKCKFFLEPVLTSDSSITINEGSILIMLRVLKKSNKIAWFEFIDDRGAAVYWPLVLDRTNSFDENVSSYVENESSEFVPLEKN